MESQILLAKVAANPTDTAWAQAYSTLNLYIVLSVKNETQEKDIVARGKELFERLQREYFSESEKTLENIKKAVEKALSGEENQNVSLVVGTIVENIFYIVIAGHGQVILKRKTKVGIVAEGAQNEVYAFSGKLEPDDIAIIETQDFAEKIPVSKLSETLDGLSVSEVAENLAPQIHGESEGGEAAIILQYKTFAGATGQEGQEEAKKPSQIPEGEPLLQEQTRVSFISSLKLPKISFPTKLLNLGKRKLIIFAIIGLAVLLFVSIIYERGRQEQIKKDSVLSEILKPAQKKIDEASALTSLNRGLALDEFNKIKESLDGKRGEFDQGSTQLKNLDEFIGKVEGKIGELSAGSTLSNQKLIFENVSEVAFDDGNLTAINEDGKIYLLQSDGKKDKEIDSKNKNVERVASDENFVYVFGDEGITQTTKSTGATKTAVGNPRSIVSLDTFGSNLYGLSTTDKTVNKYSGSSFTKTLYFAETIALKNPVSMAIDGSVWIIDEGLPAGRQGKVRKFTKGKEDSFTVTGLTKNLSSDSQIATNPDYLNTYILDPETTRIIEIGKDGEVKNQYISRELTKATSFAVDEPGKKIFVIISGKLYSFDL